MTNIEKKEILDIIKENLEYKVSGPVDEYMEIEFDHKELVAQLEKYMTKKKLKLDNSVYVICNCEKDDNYAEKFEVSRYSINGSGDIISIECVSDCGFKLVFERDSFDRVVFFGDNAREKVLAIVKSEERIRE